MDLRSILNAGSSDSSAAVARANTLPAQLHSTPQSSPQSSTRPLPPPLHPARQSSLPAFSHAPGSSPQPPYTPQPAPVATTPFQRERSISISPKTKITSIPPSVHPDPEPTQNPTPVSALDPPMDAPHRLLTGKPAGLPPEPMAASEPAGPAPSSSIISSPQRAPSRKRSISTADPVESEDLHRKRLRHGLPRWARRADWDNLQADVERIVEEVLRARAARGRPPSSRGKPTSIPVDQSPVVPAAPPPNGHAQSLPRDSPPRRPEPTITNFEPYTEFDRKIADFLFQTVVMGPDFGHPAVGGPSAVFEIEAKIGTLINRDEGSRLALPLQSEAILSPGLATRFESTMTKVCRIPYLSYR